ncbi:N-acetylmuramoyl-L-alanine amidase [Metabacillus iocasae]|uniref:N-acetylmuramoyl-L-alanine amidase n=1 Tax=Priestia iocasae TaxID=2291674 RepID=A0ABS2QWW2_9BACI|nr:N-acetylmuramoyl-L-alanine amidase [Metabacillus iocasae]MBM7703979.1 N-acetylmuramoyl-L-alanine amidase [Metabacillus iocasae]
MLKKVLSCAIAGAIVVSSPVAVIKDFTVLKAEASTNFYDVPTNHVGYDEIGYLSSKGIVTGYKGQSGSYFAPQKTVTRAQAAKMILTAIGQKEATVTTQRFSDVSKSHWGAGWIERAVQLGIFSGKQDGTFGPEDTLNRAQMSKVIAQAFKFEGDVSLGEPFDDVWVNHDFREHVIALYWEGITTGTKPTHYSPWTNVTRSQMSMFLARAMDPKFRVKVSQGEPEEPTPTPTPIQTTTEAVILTNGLNVRSTPSTTGSVIGSLSKGERVAVHSVDNYWVKIQYGNQVGYVHKLYTKLRNTSGTPVAKRIIVIDPGHGGKDPGAVSSGSTEKAIVLAVSQSLEKKLKAAGAIVLMTRAGDTYPTLGDRVEFAKNNYADMFVSIHANAATASANGTETFYDTSSNLNGEESKLLAAEINKQIVSLLNMRDRGIKDNGFFVIKNNNMPSVLVELGFITNTSDREKMLTNKDLFAEAIYRGILEYYKK